MEMAEMAEMAEEMGRNSRTLPHEIVFDILTRLPVKSLSRFRCVSKLWNSTISDRRFVKSHQSHCAFSRSVSDDGTTLLFTYPKDSNASRSLYIIVDDDDNNNNNREIKGPVREAVHQLTLPVSYSNLYVLDNLNGLICLAKDEVIKICNPSTHEFITLPTIEPEASLSPRLPVIWDANWFGYDPINNQYKLLCTWVFVTADRRLMEHRIFVLGEEEQSSWRRIGDGGLPHCPDSGNGVCVNGIIYYTAWAIDANLVDCEVLVAFDVRLETFKFVELPYGLASAGLEYFDLIRFDGHLVMFDYNCPQLGKTMDIWVLEDSVKPSWITEEYCFFD